jgi:hypothetical protein
VGDRRGQDHRLGGVREHESSPGAVDAHWTVRSRALLQDVSISCLGFGLVGADHLETGPKATSRDAGFPAKGPNVEFEQQESKRGSSLSALSDKKSRRLRLSRHMHKKCSKPGETSAKTTPRTIWPISEVIIWPLFRISPHAGTAIREPAVTRLARMHSTGSTLNRG